MGPRSIKRGGRRHIDGDDEDDDYSDDEDADDRLNDNVVVVMR